MSDSTLATIAETLGVDFPDDDAKKDALFDALNELLDEAGESAELRAQAADLYTQTECESAASMARDRNEQVSDMLKEVRARRKP